MGIDYDGVGGVGIELTDKMLESAYTIGTFTEEEWDECYDTCLSRTGLSWSQAGNSYSGDTDFYLFVDANNLAQVLENVDKFIDDVDKHFGRKLEMEDIKVISEILVW